MELGKFKQPKEISSMEITIYGLRLPGNILMRAVCKKTLL
jgi:hypothetical protein